MKAGRPVYTKALPTLADGLAVPEVCVYISTEINLLAVV